MGMSRGDFERCTPSELRAVWDRWREAEELRNREEWERLRWQMLCTLQPHSKKELTVQDVLQLPWDREIKKDKKPESGEATRARFERAKERYGLK